LLGALRDKVNQLRVALKSFQRHPHTLFYCGEGQHPLDRDNAASQRMVDTITLLLSQMHWKISRITADESVTERSRVLRGFDDGFVDAIAAIRVLDEGFDIPSCRTAFILASSNSYRQYIQRRGRVLRHAPGKETAVIYDFVAVPSPALLKRKQTIWRRQLTAELSRVRDFVSLATNSEGQQIDINNHMAQLELGAILYEEQVIDDEELYGN
jgi:superfamily II DNA or RNA helicase